MYIPAYLLERGSRIPTTMGGVVYLVDSPALVLPKVRCVGEKDKVPILRNILAPYISN